MTDAATTTDLAAPPVAWGDIIPLVSKEWQDLPDVKTPYYTVTKEGWYIHQRTDAGRWLTRIYRQPNRLQPLGNTNGKGVFDGAVIPAAIYAQAVDFFRRIFAAHRTEAEVLITQHQTTKEYRLFVPTQRVSHGGVYSYYNPKHIGADYLVVGTFHSHCDFSPYHSSTDEGDARDMDGIHGTIGWLLRDVPGMALMVASHGTLFQFDNVTDVVDTSDLTAGTAPAWWDRYMVFGKVTDADRPAWIDDVSWDKYMDRYVKPKPVTQNTWKPQTPPPAPKAPQLPAWHQLAQNLRGKPRNNRPAPAIIDPELYELMVANGYQFDPSTNSYRVAEVIESTESDDRLLGPGIVPDPDWDLEGALLPDEIKRLADEGEDDYWETALGRAYVDGLMTSGLFNEEDLEWAIRDFPESGTKTYWNKVMQEKLSWAVDWLNDWSSIEVNVSMKLKGPVPPVEGQVTVDEAIAAAHTGA